MTIDTNRTIIAQNGTDGQRVVLRILQSGSGHTVTFGSMFHFGSDIPAANLSTTNGEYDYVTCVYNGTTSKWDVVDVVRGF
jgi:hypothetical protein